MAENTNIKCGCIKGSAGIVPVQFGGSVGIIDTRITGFAGIICKPNTRVYILIDPPNVLLSSDGEAVQFGVTSNTSWEVENGGKIKWEKGEGYITVVYGGERNEIVSVLSDDNEGLDRSQSVLIESTNKAVFATLLVEQVGLREIFKPADGEFVIADGGTLNVLKNSVNE